MNVILTDEELAIVLPLFAATDAAKQGYAQGLEMAKMLLVQQIVARRPTNESVNTAGAGSAQHAPASPADDAASWSTTSSSSGTPNGHA